MRLMTRSLTSIAILLVILALSCARPSEQKTTHIVSHDKVLVFTDKSQGFNTFSNWAIFPGSDTQYRKVTLEITYACPDSLHCGEWDYIDGIYLRRIGGEAADSLNIEIARMISPYGWRFDSTWSYQWNVDITDFALFLHDSVEVEFRHTGYENSDDRGWLITLDFEINEGRPAMEIFAMDTLWCGQFAYGDSSKPIEEYLAPIKFSSDSAEIVRLRIHQTGHGMDDQENCAEFCEKYRRVYFDDSLVNQRQIWRECGDNSLYPQAGTWIFDRANWCPGQVVYPDNYDWPINGADSHSVNIDMEPYLNPNNPSANWWIYSYLFYCKAPWAKNDVSLEEMLIPSLADDHSRDNPACANPRIRVKNSGSDRIKSLVIQYGTERISTETFNWSGDLKSQATTIIDLPNRISSDTGLLSFMVTLSRPNDQRDEYPEDNVARQTYRTTPVHPSTMVVAFKANKEPDHNSYFLQDYEGNRIVDRLPGTLVADSIYLDSVALDPGCYQLVVADTSGDGLDLWFNPEGGYGYVRLLTLDGELVKNFNPDFGHGVKYWFRVDPAADMSPLSEEAPLMRIFPPRNQGQFGVDLFFNETTDLNIRVESDSSGTIYQDSISGFKAGIPQIDLGKQPDGRYKVVVTTAKDSLSQPMRIRN